MKAISTFLDDITPLLTESKEEDIDSIRKMVDTLFQALDVDKKQLVTKWIEINGETSFKVLQVTTSDYFFKVLNIILLSSIEYLNRFNDPLYMLAQISIAADWYCFKSLNI